MTAKNKILYDMKHEISSQVELSKNVIKTDLNVFFDYKGVTLESIKVVVIHDINNNENVIWTDQPI